MAVLLWRGDGVAMLGQQLREALLPGEAGFRVEHDEVLAVQSMASDVSVRELLSRLAQQDDASTAVEARPAVAWYPHDGASAAELLAVVRARAAHAATTVAA